MHITHIESKQRGIVKSKQSKQKGIAKSKQNKRDCKIEAKQAKRDCKIEASKQIKAMGLSNICVIIRIYAYFLRRKALVKTK